MNELLINLQVVNETVFVRRILLLFVLSDVRGRSSRLLLLRRCLVHSTLQATEERVLPLHPMSAPLRYVSRIILDSKMISLFSSGAFLALASAGCPFVHTIHFPANAFSWTQPDAETNLLDSYSVASKPWKTRWRCRTCGACVASTNSKSGYYSVWVGQLARGENGKIVGSDLVKPTAHIFYETRIVDVNDGLGKWAGYEGNSTRLDAEV